MAIAGQVEFAGGIGDYYGSGGTFRKAGPGDDDYLQLRRRSPGGWRWARLPAIPARDLCGPTAATSSCAATARCSTPAFSIGYGGVFEIDNSGLVNTNRWADGTDRGTGWRNPGLGRQAGRHGQRDLRPVATAEQRRVERRAIARPAPVLPPRGVSPVTGSSRPTKGRPSSSSGAAPTCPRRAPTGSSSRPRRR